jgi:hypothetical protein
MGPTGPIANQLDNFFVSTTTNNVTLTTSYGAVLATVTFTVPASAGPLRDTVAMFSGVATPGADPTAVTMTTGIFLNNGLEDEIIAGYSTIPINGSDFRGARLPPGEYTVSVRAKATATKTGNTLTYRIAII